MLILSLGLGLRLFNFGELSLGNDELSVLARIQYDSFAELIEEGVKPDVHPAGIQVLAFYWCSIFGDSPFALRFPFLLAGIFSIFLSYKIGVKWFSEESGLLTAACMASLQYFITLGVYARPYALVLGLTMAMIYFLTKIIQESQPPNWIYWTYALCSTLCLYFHYFSFLIVGSSVLMGLIFISGKKKNKFLLSLVLILILYLPHLGIFMYHLEKGGSEWIGKPDADFFYTYFLYVFHFSPLLILFIFLVVVGLFLWKGGEMNSILKKFRTISFSLFLLPLALGYLYSVWRAPVLHSNGLIASFPFLLLFFFSFVPKLQNLQKGMLIAAILILNIWTLISERQHYKVFYNRSAEALVQSIEENEDKYKDRLIDHFLQLHSPFYADYYLEENTSEVEIISYDLAKMGGVKGLREYLKNSKAERISLGWLSKPLPDYFIPIVREFYPGIEQRDNYFISESWLFSKDSAQSQGIIFSQFEDKGFVAPGWNIEAEKLDPYKENAVPFSDWTFEQEFGPAIEFSLEEINGEIFNELWVEFELKAENPITDIKLVVEYLPPDGKNHWHASLASQYISKPMDWNSIHFFRRIQHLGVEEAKGKLKIYIWNPGKENYSIKRYNLRIEEGNPWLYSLVEKLP